MARRPQLNERQEAAIEATSDEKRVHEEALLVQAADVRKNVIAQTTEAEQILEHLRVRIEDLNQEAFDFEKNRDAAAIKYREQSKLLELLEKSKERVSLDYSELVKQRDEFKANSDAELASLHEGYAKHEEIYTRTLNQIDSQIEAASAELSNLKVVINSLTDAKSVLDEEILTKKKHIVSLDNDILALEKQLADLQPNTEKLNELRINIGRSEAELEKNQVLINQAQEERVLVIEDINKKKAELDEKIRINNLVETSIDQKSERLKQLIERAFVAGVIKEKII